MFSWLASVLVSSPKFTARRSDKALGEIVTKNDTKSCSSRIMKKTPTPSCAYLVHEELLSIHKYIHSPRTTFESQPVPAHRIICSSYLVSVSVCKKGKKMMRRKKMNKLVFLQPSQMFNLQQTVDQIHLFWIMYEITSCRCVISVKKEWTSPDDCIQFLLTDHKDDMTTKVQLLEKMRELLCPKCSPPKGRTLVFMYILKFHLANAVLFTRKHFSSNLTLFNYVFAGGLKTIHSTQVLNWLAVERVSWWWEADTWQLQGGAVSETNKGHDSHQQWQAECWSLWDCDRTL